MARLAQKLRGVWAAAFRPTRCRLCRTDYVSFQLHMCPRGALYMMQEAGS